jgi:hypothetical protein
MIEFIGTFLQLKLIISAHNQWVPKTRSIPYWTTSVFHCDEWRTKNHFPAELNEEWRLTNERTLPSVLTCSPFITSGEPNRHHHVEQLVVILSVVRRNGNVLTEPLPIKWEQQFSLLYVVNTGTGAHPTTSPVGTGSKTAGAWSWPLTSSQYQSQENVGLYIHSSIRLHDVVLK